MATLALQRTDTDSLYCNPTEDGGSVSSAPSIKSVKSSTSSAASSVQSGSRSTKSRSTTRSKSSTSSVPKSANWKAAIDPLGMSTKSVGPGFMPSFSTHLYAPGFQAADPTKSKEGPKSFQNKQLKFVEKKRTPPGSAAASTKSGKSGKSGKSEKASASSSDKSVKSSSSSTKSTFFSSLTENFDSNGESATSLNDKKNDVAELPETSAPKEESNHTTTLNDTDNSSNSGIEKSESAATVKATDDLVVLAEDHSSRNSSARTILKQTIEYDASRRPSIAESIMQLRSSTQKPQHTPNEILLKRVISWEYLARVHGGKMAYYNTILLTEYDFRRFYTPDIVQKRAHHYFLLGTSIANVLDIPNISDYAKALSSILHEFEEYISSETKSKMNFFKGRKITDYRPFEEPGEFSHFEVRTMPFDMDFTVIFATLSDMIAQCYKRFDTQKSDVIVSSDVFHKIDVRFKKLLLIATKELETLTREAMQEELYALDPMAGFTVDWDQQVLAIGH
ncbi:hypothetical protein BGX27_011230 [Mortierella sp. AM989]|nr:hypothetical protein BGX27_011230 [Mortierella sp. AM989]